MRDCLSRGVPIYLHVGTYLLGFPHAKAIIFQPLMSLSHRNNLEGLKVPNRSHILNSKNDPSPLSDLNQAGTLHYSPVTAWNFKSMTRLTISLATNFGNMEPQTKTSDATEQTILERITALVEVIQVYYTDTYACCVII